ncbi:GNAT family N-acetyltransferase [Nocardioides hwasunensis]|uniref:GNAT family N-acetyltransferase n=1 Tax=Nocardioides hwasunensis TaxID=397258 RepID=A0ABR8MIX2_9ACTN|nr:GNAT family N-acetyltransferase [Nocardioides hwasunensis]MBD3914044.1 GNAT family N-acetyltransferase [Nocardioides hwasunensis]
MTLTIHPLKPWDAAAHDRWHHVYLVAERHDLGPAETAWQLEEVRAMMQDTGTQASYAGWWGAVDGEVVVAGWMRAPLLDNVELAEVMVHVLPEHRRQGHGSAMLAHVETHIASLG